MAEKLDQDQTNNHNEGEEKVPETQVLIKSPRGELQNFANGEAPPEYAEEGTEIPPPDKWKMVYLILMIHGIGTLMPWNMFITANSYFVDYKLATNSSSGSEYQRNFISYLGITAQIPNVVLNGINLFCQCGGGNISRRIIWSIIICVVMFIVTVGLAMVDSSGWPGAFFAVTMATVVLINMANGVYQNSVYGLAAILPMKYTNAVILGSNTSGTFASIISIMSIAMAPDPRTAAIYYFITAILVLLIAFDTYFALPLLKFYRYYKRRATDAKSADEASNYRPPYWYVFKKCWVQLFGVWFVFFVTLTLFPAIQVGIKKVDKNFPISDKYFTPVTTFLFFNTFAMLGNLVTEWIRKPGPRWVWIPILIRGLFFIPFFMLCNYRPESRGLPVLIANDYVYIIGGIIMAFTSGYFSSLTMMYAPGCVEPKHQGTAGMMAAFFLILGIFSGVNFSLVVAYFVENVGH